MPVELERVGVDSEYEWHDPQLLQGKRVVICECEAVFVMHMRQVMKQAGMTIVGEAANGEDGLEITLRERPDIVLIDNNMPVMDGFEASQRILEEYQPCIIMLTSYVDEEFRAQVAALGIGGYVIKPVTHDILISAATQVFEQFCVR